ncbi:hypothetical protein PINS_up018236 [Pythium insidiosum]|nr:hypothetical protein PINS_up018236 [Pythium insidiosum]
MLTLNTIRSKVFATTTRHQRSEIVPLGGGGNHGLSVEDAPNVSHLNRFERPVHRGSNVLFGVLGFTILVLHVFIVTRNDDIAGARCLVGVRNGISNKLPCAALEINCYRLGAGGNAAEVSTVLERFDVDVLSGLRLAHCPALEVPSSLQKLHTLAIFEIYNSTLVKWGADAALTRQHHPNLGCVWIFNLRNVVQLPDGMLAHDFPAVQVSIAETELQDLPNDLHERWPRQLTGLAIRYSALKSIPETVDYFTSAYIDLTGNNISSVSAAALGDRFLTVSLGSNPLTALPDYGWYTVWLDIAHTNVTVLPAWIQEQWASPEAHTIVTAHRTPICDGNQTEPTHLLWCADFIATRDDFDALLAYLRPL